MRAGLEKLTNKRDILFGSIKDRVGARRYRSIKCLAMVIPFIIFVFAFSYVPLFGWLYAFCDFRIGMVWNDFQFVGFENFITLLTDKDLFRVLRNTFVMSLSGLLLSPLPILVSIMINDIKSDKLKRFIQTSTTFPNFISWVVVLGLANALFAANGLLNQAIKVFGGTSPFEFGLIGERDLVWQFQISLQQWKGLGWSCIIYLAAIAGIDAELYDAAKVDGANKLQLIRYITIPGVMPTFLVLTLLAVSNILSCGFEQYYVFWNSLVVDKIEVLDYFIYKVGLRNMKYSVGIAAGILKNGIGIFLLFGVNNLSRKIRGESIV